MLLRWHIQRGSSTAFKATTPQHIQSNLEALDFELPPEDMRALTTIAYTVSSRRSPQIMFQQGISEHPHQVHGSSCSLNMDIFHPMPLQVSRSALP